MAICVGCGIEIPAGKEAKIEGKVYCPGCAAKKRREKK